MTLIELGDVSSGSAEPAPAAPRRADVRRFAVAAVAALCLLGVTGSERPAPRGPTTLWSVPATGGAFAVTADAVYVLDQRRGEADLRAYAAADGTLRWTRPFDREARWVSSEISGILLVPTMSGVLGDGSSPAVVETVALDAATGAVRWRQPGDPSLGTADSIVLADWDAVRNSMRDMRMVRTADGRQRWALPRAAAVDSWTTTGVDPERPDRLITVDRAGRVEVRRLSDGGVVAGMTAPRPPGPQEGALQLYSSGAHLFVIRLDGAEQMITAYEVDTLRARWQRSYPSATGVFDCGALLCAGAADGEVDALDPATGAVRWRAAGWDYARSAGDGTLLVESHETGRHGLVDEATGRTLADFGPGFAALDPDTGTVLSLAPAQSLPPRLKLQRRTTSGEVVLLGAVPTGGADGCELAAGRLVCAGGGVLIVTDVG